MSKQQCPKCGFEFNGKKSDEEKAHLRSVMDKWQQDKLLIHGALRLLFNNGIYIGTRELLESARECEIAAERDGICLK